MALRIQLRRDTAANWTADDPVLAQGEIGVETDASPIAFKIGDGSTAWSLLDYFAGATPPAWDGDITDIDFAGGTEIAGALADGDLFALRDISGSVNRTSLISRIWDYIKTKASATLVAGDVVKWAADLATMRSNLGATTAGANFFTLTNPGAITFPRINADNTVTALSNTDFRTALGVGTGDSVTIASLTLTANSAASTPVGTMTGTWFTGGSATTTKPHFLIEPTGTTSTAWSTSGTGLGVNAATGFTGNILDLQLNGARRFGVSSSGSLTFGSTALGEISVDGAGKIRLNATSSGEIESVGAFQCRGHFRAVAQALSGNGAVAAVNNTSLTTTIANTGTANTTTTLAAGTDGQIKTIVFITDGGFDAVVTVTNAIWGGAGTITMNDAGDSIMLQYLGSKWQVLSNNGCTLA